MIIQEENQPKGREFEDAPIPHDAVKLKQPDDVIQYRRLGADEISRKLFDGFRRRQIVTKCWRREKGEWIIREDPFVDDWSASDYQQLLAHLRKVIQSGGFVYAAFYRGILKGFVSVDVAPFGDRREYLDLTNIHVSEDMRRKGIGKKLFLAAAEWAKKEGAGKLYISAHSAVESQAFYRSLGCVEAVTYNPKHVEEEPYDCQMEYRL